MNNILLHTVSIYLCTVPDDVYNLGMLLSPVLLYNIQYTIYVQYIQYTLYIHQGEYLISSWALFSQATLTIRLDANQYIFVETEIL